MNTEKNTDAVRRARRELHDKVRNDWDSVLARALPQLPPSYLPYQWTPDVLDAENSKAQQLADTARHPFRKRKAEAEESPYEGLLGFVDAPDTAGGEALDWCERTYAPSDPSSDEDEEDSGSINGVVGNLLGKLGIGGKSGGDAKADNGHNHDTHEQIGTNGADENGHSTADADRDESEMSLDTEDLEYLSALDKEERKKLLRARRRRKRLEREMRWNDGLRYWEMRRDVWCCAKPRLPANASSSRNSGETSDPPSIFDKDTSTPASSSSNTNDNSNQTPEDASLRSHQSQSQTQTQTTTRPPPMLLPIAPPLLPDTDPTRSRVTPAAYPTVYTKLVTRSLSPSVPLNLSVVVPSLVEGWKETGDWPTGTPADPTIYVDPTNASQTSKPPHTHQSTSISALAGVTKNGLRALGGRANPVLGSSAKKAADAKRRQAGKAKTQTQIQTSQQQAQEEEYSKMGDAQTPPTQRKGAGLQNLAHSPKSIFTSGRHRRSPNSTPDSPSPSRSTHQKQGDGGQDGNSQHDAAASSEPSGSKRVRKSVAKVGKALKEGFSVSPASGDGAAS